jgi:uncharacterized protein (DUF934 family)
MPLLKNGQIIKDRWVALDDTQIVPPDGAVVVDLDRWLAESEALKGRRAPLGLRLLPGQSAETIRDDLAYFELIALEFPTFKDGRAYSYARLLRQDYGFEGELRAVGEVLQDQLAFMVRVGFDAFEVDERITPEIFASEMNKFSNVYQPASDEQETILSLRG